MIYGYMRYQRTSDVPLSCPNILSVSVTPLQTGAPRIEKVGETRHVLDPPPVSVPVPGDRRRDET